MRSMTSHILRTTYSGRILWSIIELANTSKCAFSCAGLYQSVAVAHALELEGDDVGRRDGPLSPPRESLSDLGRHEFTSLLAFERDLSSHHHQGGLVINVALACSDPDDLEMVVQAVRSTRPPCELSDVRVCTTER